MTSKHKLVELVENDCSFVVIEEPRIIDYSNEKEKNRQILELAFPDAIAYRLGERRRSFKNGRSVPEEWHQAVQYYKI